MNRDDLMSAYGRIEEALDHVLAAKKELDRAEVDPDNVEQRRAMARAARHYRQAADLLDDGGRFQ